MRGARRGGSHDGLALALAKRMTPIRVERASVMCTWCDGVVCKSQFTCVYVLEPRPGVAAANMGAIEVHLESIETEPE